MRRSLDHDETLMLCVFEYTSGRHGDKVLLWFESTVYHARFGDVRGHACFANLAHPWAHVAARTGQPRACSRIRTNQCTTDGGSASTRHHEGYKICLRGRGSSIDCFVSFGFSCLRGPRAGKILGNVEDKRRRESPTMSLCRLPVVSPRQHRAMPLS